MGRNFYCEYCDKRLKCSVSIRKSHNEGLPHKIAKAEYLAKIRDPRDILAEERNKTPCNRFLKGSECKFGLICRFSHYTYDQLNELERISQQLNMKTASSPIHHNQAKCENKALSPWKYPYEKVQHIHLPPSLQPYDFADMIENKNTRSIPQKIEWG